MNTIQEPMGNLNEVKLHKLLNNLYGPVYKTAFKMNIMDFVSQDGLTKIEMKSRTNYYNTYPTTMVGANKIKHSINKPHKKYVYIFVFIDGTYEWIFSKENYELAGGDNSIKQDDPDNPIKKNFHIPIEHLKKISNEGCSIPDSLKDKIPLPKGTCFIKIKKTCC